MEPYTAQSTYEILDQLLEENTGLVKSLNEDETNLGLISSYDKRMQELLQQHGVAVKVLWGLSTTDDLGMSRYTAICLHVSTIHECREMSFLQSLIASKCRC